VWRVSVCGVYVYVICVSSVYVICGVCNECSVCGVCVRCVGGGCFDPWVGKIHWRWAWQPTPVSLPGEFHGQRSLEDCSPWDCEELGTTE